jgi:hypothetical protein
MVVSGTKSRPLATYHVSDKTTGPSKRAASFAVSFVEPLGDLLRALIAILALVASIASPISSPACWPTRFSRGF